MCPNSVRHMVGCLRDGLGGSSCLGIVCVVALGVFRAGRGLAVSLGTSRSWLEGTVFVADKYIVGVVIGPWEGSTPPLQWQAICDHALKPATSPMTTQM
jgi:hypothetical protein